MKKLFAFPLATCLLILISASSFLQGQNTQSLDTISAPTTIENIYNKPLFSDSNSSSFLIIVKKEVRLHVHKSHSEQVYVISGTADMFIGDKTIHIKAGDLIYIPANTQHSVIVTSSDPLKILSIQAPYYDGKDKIFIEK